MANDDRVFFLCLFIRLTRCSIRRIFIWISSGPILSYFRFAYESLLANLRSSLCFSLLWLVTTSLSVTISLLSAKTEFLCVDGERHSLHRWLALCASPSFVAYEMKNEILESFLSLLICVNDLSKRNMSLISTRATTASFCNIRRWSQRLSESQSFLSIHCRE